MVNELLTLNFKKVKRSKNKSKFILCTKCKVQPCISGFNLLGEKLLSYFFGQKKMLWKKGEREERDEEERKGREARREREREKQVYFNFPNQTCPSRLVYTFSTFHWLSHVITYNTLNFISGQFCSLSFNAHTCFGQNAKRLSRLKTGIFHTQQSGGL